MRKSQRERLEKTIGGMEPEDQIILAGFLIEELSLNESVLNDDECDKEKTSEFRLVLEKYAEMAENITEKKKIIMFLKKFSSLPLTFQKRVVEEIMPDFMDEVNSAVKASGIEKCGLKGHTFSDEGWKTIKWTTYEDEWYEGQFYKDYPTEHTAWTKTCSNCGFKEETNIEPLEEKAKRINDGVDESVKKLRLEINKLESKKINP